MAIEIERKFLVRDAGIVAGLAGERIVQGYAVKEDGHMTVRVRILEDRQVAFLTLKSPLRGLRRDEYEYSIPIDDAHAMLANHCDHRIVRKTRHAVVAHGQCFEVDVFDGVHRGLVIAELELGHEHQAILRPHWLGEEVSLDRRYGNYSLALEERAHMLAARGRYMGTVVPPRGLAA
ncbi:MAG: CYTH domain-containing protein [Zoogloeaceae bacterium]|nr:CYTH domain-containing protein [Rhodocyclaceae bacterium]MCP5236145.1 CYTH domain-containing protein [Zoogloeaceae bacterium]